MGEGVWQIETESSTYFFDVGAGTVSRWPGGAASSDGDAVLHAELRRDGEEIQVVAADMPKVGLSWRLLLDLRGDGVMTVRLTTLVCHVQRLS